MVGGPVIQARALPRPCPTCGEVAHGVFCPADGTPLAGAFSIGGDRYHVNELIGGGSMGVVFGGTYQRLSRPVAVKVLRPEVARNEAHQQRFLQEARSASLLTHENIVGVLDFGRDDELEVTYMVMERLRGETLAAALAARGHVPWRDAVAVLTQIARGVAAAHAQGIVHRDLGPRNVMLVAAAGRQVAKLCDFGLSRRTEDGGRITQSRVAETLAYMAPEQSEGDTAEPAADVYSIGALGYELLTGHPPVVGAPALEPQASKLADQAVPISRKAPELGVPDELDSLITRCLAREPADRPSAAELERALLRLEARATSLGGGSSPGIAIPRTLTPSLPSLEDGSDGAPSMIGSYRVVRSLGSGGTGRVYLGEHPVIGTKVAIKVLLPEIAGSRETVDRFIQEARSSSQIDSPHIPRYYDFGRTAGGLPYAVMEYFEGQTLAEYIEKEGALSVEETAGILSQVAGALALAHKAGLVHRDLKPENLFLVAAERPSGGSDTVGRASSSPGSLECAFSVKVLDFGIAKSFGKESGTRTQQGFFLGTPFYCSPEQVFGAEVDPRADVYALGVTAFEMLTGMPPFVGEISEVLEAKTSRDAPLLRSERAELPARVERTVARMLTRELAARAESMAWVREEVEGWLRVEEDELESPSSRPPTARAAALTAPGSVRGALGAQGSGPLLAPLADSGRARAPRRLTSDELESAVARESLESPAAPDALDALDTITIGGGRVPTIVPPAAASPWRRPLMLAGASGLVAVAAVLGLKLGGGGSSDPVHAPVVTPIERSAREPAGAAGGETTAPEGPEPTALGTDTAAGEPGEPSADEPGADEPGADGADEPGADEPGATPRKHPRSGKKRREDRADRRRDKPAQAKPSEPPPPSDVKLVDPFANEK